MGSSPQPQFFFPFSLDFFLCVFFFLPFSLTSPLTQGFSFRVYFFLSVCRLPLLLYKENFIFILFYMHICFLVTSAKCVSKCQKLLVDSCAYVLKFIPTFYITTYTKYTIQYIIVLLYSAFDYCRKCLWLQSPLEHLIRQHRIAYNSSQICHV